MKLKIFFAFLALTVLFSFTKSPLGLNPGETAPDFNLKNIDGKSVSLKDFKNVNGYIVVFTCNHCPFAKMYEDRLIALDKKYKPLGYPVIAINPNDPIAAPDDSYDEMKVRAKEKGFTFPYLFDDGQKVYPQYGATRTPHVFLLDKNRVVKYIGSIDDNPSDVAGVKAKFLEDAIAAHQAGKDIIPNVTKALGCGIKAKKA